MNIRTVNNGVLVVWDWEWKDYQPSLEVESDGKDDTDSEGCEDVEESKPENEQSDDDDSVNEGKAESDIPLVTHTVTFKCIGAPKDEYQDTLREARNRLAKGFTVPVRLTPEPM